MYIELDKPDFYIRQAKSNLAQKYLNLHKNSRAPPYLFSVSRAFKSGVVCSRAMDSPRDKTSRSHHNMSRKGREKNEK